MVIGCKPDNDDDDDAPKTLDQRLVGGKWHRIISSQTPIAEKEELRMFVTYMGSWYLYSDGYYEFTNSGADSLFTTKNTVLEILGQPLPADNAVYSDDGRVYWKNSGEQLIVYSFHSSFPFTQMAIKSEERYIYNSKAASGDLITYHGDSSFALGEYFDGYYYSYFLVRYYD
jgi:hypothetical protein